MESEQEEESNQERVKRIRGRITRTNLQHMKGQADGSYKARWISEYGENIAGVDVVFLCGLVEYYMATKGADDGDDPGIM